MKSFAQKKAELAKLKDKLGRAKLTVFTTFARAGEKGLDVKQMAELKRGLRASQAEYLVGKRTLMERALGAIYQHVDMSIYANAGSPALAFGYGDEQAVAKTLYSFSRKNPALKFFGALWGGQLMDEASFVAFAKLPGREVLLGRLLGLMKYPLTTLANVLSQIAEKR